MKYYITYSYTISTDLEDRSDIRSKIIDFKYCVESKKDLIYLRAELLHTLQMEKASELISDDNLCIINFYPLQENVEMSDEPIKYLVSYHLTAEGLVSGQQLHRVYSKMYSKNAPLVTENEFLSLENRIKEEINIKNINRFKAINVAILNYIQIE